MRWALRIMAILLAVWAFFLVSPFLALYSFAEAVKAHDLARIEERVNIRAVRLSLSKQIITEYLKTNGRGQELESRNRQLAGSAGAAIADPLVSQLVTPQALIDLLDDGWPEGVVGAKPPAFVELNLAAWQRAWRLFVRSEPRGFRKILIPVPEDQPPEERFRLELRLDGATWRLFGVEVPTVLLQRLVKELPRLEG